jgi:magnesium-transporting ATPase (P-type)
VTPGGVNAAAAAGGGGATTTQTFTLLHNLEFSSDRKRSSVIVRRPDGSVVLFCKGADNIITKRLSPTLNSESLLAATYAHLDQYVNDGLRTLLVGKVERTRRLRNGPAHRSNVIATHARGSSES